MVSSRTKALILFACSVFNFIYIASYVTYKYRVQRGETYTYIGHDFPERLPLPEPLETVLVPLDDSARYLPLGNTTEKIWAATSPAGGFVRLGPEDRAFVVSMFHELHCLRMINRAFTKSPGITLPHVWHCLNYIRQNVMCSPDLALEPGNFEERDFEIERSNGVHVCKNWDQVYDFMDDRLLDWKEQTTVHIH